MEEWLEIILFWIVVGFILGRLLDKMTLKRYKQLQQLKKEIQDGKQEVLDVQTDKLSKRERQGVQDKEEVRE